MEAAQMRWRAAVAGLEEEKVSLGEQGASVMRIEILHTARYWWWPAGNPKAFERLVHLVQARCPETSTFW